MRMFAVGYIALGGIQDGWHNEQGDIDRWENDGGRCSINRQGL